MAPEFQGEAGSPAPGKGYPKSGKSGESSKSGKSGYLNAQTIIFIRF
jgi:hypothetical protein